MATKLGGHVQAWGPEVQTWLRIARPSVVKWLEYPRDMLTEVKAWGGVNVVRCDVGLGSLDVGGIVGRIQHLQGSLGALVDYYELWNEPSPNGDDLSRLNDATCAALDQLRCPVLVGSIAEGNPASMADWPRFYPAMRLAMQYGGGIALHEYDCPTLTSSGTDRVLRYRQSWATWPDDVKAIPIYLTELGIDGGVIGQPEKGWMDYTDEAGYLSQLQSRDGEFCQDNGGARPNLRGATIFTCGHYDPWGRFEISGALSIARSIGASAQTTGGSSVDQTQLEQKVAQLLQQNALLTDALKAFRQGKFSGADGIDGIIVALQGGQPLDFTPTYPPKA